MERKRSVEQLEGFVCKSLEVFENGTRKSSPESVKFSPETLDRDRSEFWDFSARKGRQTCQAGMKIDAWMDSLNVCDRKMEFFDLEPHENEQKRNILIRHDFGKEIRSTFAGEIQSNNHDRGVSPKREVLIDIPLSPETQKKNELCSYLQLMNMNNADKKTVSAIQNRRSNRVKNLKILSEKRDLEQKLLAEFKESLEKKSFEELGLVVKENYQITNTVEKINFNIELIPESLLREVENFDDSIMKVIGTDIKKKIQNDHKNNNLKENKGCNKKKFLHINNDKKITKHNLDNKVDKPKVILKKNNYDTKSLRSSINLNDVGIKALTLNERKFKSLRSVVNLNNVGIKSLTLNERKIKQIANRKKIEMEKSFISRKLRYKENAKRINVKIKMNNERINNKPRISLKNGNVRRSMDRVVTRKQKMESSIEKMRINAKRREMRVRNEKMIKNQDDEIIKNPDDEVVRNQDDGTVKKQGDKLIKIQDIKIINIEDGKVIVRSQCGTILNRRESRVEKRDEFRETRNGKYIIRQEENENVETRDVIEEPKIVDEETKIVKREPEVKNRDSLNRNRSEVNNYSPSKMENHYDNSTCHKTIRQPDTIRDYELKQINSSKIPEKSYSKTITLPKEKVAISNDVNINYNEYKMQTTKNVHNNLNCVHEKKSDFDTQTKLYSLNTRGLSQTTTDCLKNTKSILFHNTEDESTTAISPRTTRSELSPRSQRIRLTSGLSPISEAANFSNLAGIYSEDIAKLEKKKYKEISAETVEKRNIETIKNNVTELNGETLDGKKRMKINDIKLKLGMVPLKKRRISLLSTGIKSTEKDLVEMSNETVYNKDLRIEERKDNVINGKKTPEKKPSDNKNDVPTAFSPESTISPNTISSSDANHDNSLSPISRKMAEISKCVFREDKTEMLSKLQASFNVVDLSQSSCVNNSLHANYINYNCWQEHNYTKKPELEMNKYNRELLISDSDEREFLKESYKEIPRINSVPPNDIFEPKIDTAPLEKPSKMQIKPTKNLHKLLTQKNRNNLDTLETLSNENCFDEQVSTNSVKIDLAKGKILNAHYLGFNLVVIQEQLISFWTQSPLGNMLGVHNLWVSKGQVQRLPLDSNYICKDSQEVVVNLENKSCAYIELWMKEHKSEKRELPLADVFATVYFWTSKSAAELNKKLLQLANIKGNIKDVQYVVLRTARKIVVSWVETQNTPLTTIVSCYALSPDYQTVVNILELTSVNHYVRSLHTMGDCCDVVVGFGENHITIWELEYGEIFETIEISQRYSNPKMLWLERDRGLLFFIQYHKLERLLMLVAVNGYSKESKKMQVFRIPAGYNTLKGLCVDNNMLSAVFKNGIICWNIRTGDEIVAELSSHPHLIPSSKHLIALKSNTVEVTHFQSYFLTNFDLQL